MDMVKEFHERMKGPATQKYRTLGTVENILINNTLNACPHAIIQMHLRMQKVSGKH
jgi:hypothetical protein